MKPSIPQGTRDFLPQQAVKRGYIFDTIKSIFQKYGYLPIETPAMEKLETLTGKYGEEGDKLLYKIRSNKNILEHYPQLKNCQCLKELYPYDWIPMTSDKALRYDLTVPFARYVVQHQNEITFPFKRYQIQPVWRADRPQKGRYREFYQCDADVIGSNSLLNEVEIILMIDEVFSALKIAVTIKINNRKYLQGIADIIGEPDRMTDIAIAMDKIEKIGLEKAIDELQQKGISEDSLKKLTTILDKNQSIELSMLTKGSENMKKAYDEMGIIIKCLAAVHFDLNKIETDIFLARGLTYYTGTIFEVKANGVEMGSLCGGGRYDDLTGIFGLKEVSGVGISFGADRIYDVMETQSLFPRNIEVATKVLFVNFGETEAVHCLPFVKKLRDNGISTELYPDATKLKKQFDYANKKGIPWVVVVGTEEMQTGILTIKNMTSGEQQKINIDELIVKMRESVSAH